MKPKEYIEILNKLQFSEDLQQVTLNNLKNYTGRFSINWKYKLIIATATIEMYFLGFGILTCV